MRNVTVPSGLFMGAGLGGLVGLLFAKTQANKVSYALGGAVLGGAVGHFVGGITPETKRNLLDPKRAVRHPTDEELQARQIARLEGDVKPPTLLSPAIPPETDEFGLPKTDGLVQIGNVDDFWGDSWQESDDQRFYDEDQFNPNYNVDSYGYGPNPGVGGVREEDLAAAVEDLEDAAEEFADGLPISALAKTPTDLSYIENDERHPAVKVSVLHAPDQYTFVRAVALRAAKNNGGLRTKQTATPTGSTMTFISPYVDN